MTPMKESTERLTIWIDPSIKYHAKVKALQNRTTLSKVIEDLLDYYLRTKHAVPPEQGPAAKGKRDAPPLRSK